MEEDWDVDDYRGDHESDEHWTLRREFMVTNKSAFPRLRLLSLSQVFSNVEFMGCRYPEETMAVVAELSTGIVEGYRAKQKSRLQRTFMKASSAAEAKSKRVYHNNKPSDSGPQVAGSSQQRNDSPLTSANDDDKMANFNNSRRRGPKRNGNSDPLTKKSKKPVDTDLSTLVLVELKYAKDENPISILHQSCQKSGKEYKFENPEFDTDSGLYKCSFKLGDFIVEGTEATKSSAKHKTAAMVLERLQKICYTVHIHGFASSDGIGKDDVLRGKTSGPAPLREDNVGNKLMRLMGYTGGALGKTGQGIEVPIDTTDSVGRQRLGLGSGKSGPKGKLTHAIAAKFLQGQMQRSEWKDVVFSHELTNDERSLIHSAASILGLKSRSYGKDDARFLVISKKLMLWDMLQELLISGNTEQYRVFPPGDVQTTPQTSVTIE